MTKEQLKNLKLEDLQAPNQVLCYGAGEMGTWWASAYSRMGIHVAGFIDRNRSGKIAVQGGELQAYSIQAAAERFDQNVLIAITLSNAALVEQIRLDLRAAGFTNIVDYDFVNWITVPSEKCFCEDLFHSTMLHPGGLARCDHFGIRRVFIPEMRQAGASMEEYGASYFEKTDYYYEQALKGRVPLYCSGCPRLRAEKPEHTKLKLAVFGITADCNMDCIYCTTMQSDRSRMPCNAKEAGERFLEFAQYLAESGRAAPNMSIEFSGGEISVSPVRDQLLDFALAHPEFQYFTFSNCVVYNEKIAELLSRRPENYVLCDLDAGTPESYFLVKGYNHFDRALDTLKKYAQRGTVYLKYIVLPGFNTTPEDYAGTVRLMRELGLSKLILSMDYQHPIDEFKERKVLFEVARLKKTAVSGGIDVFLLDYFFDARRMGIIDRFYKQM